MSPTDDTQSLYVKKSKNNIIADFSPLIFSSLQKTSLMRLNNLLNPFICLKQIKQ